MDIKGDFVKTLAEFDYDAECREALLSALDLMLRDESASDGLCGFVGRYAKGELDWAGLTAFADETAERLGIHSFTTRIIAYIALVPYSMKFFTEAGLGVAEWYDSMIDLKWKARETKDVYGIWGTHTDWFRMFYTAERVAFGRLQFNPVAADVDFVGRDFEVRKGDRVITVHIPSDDRTPFDKANREAAYARAREFFAPMFKDGRVIFRCGSWLLNPAHREILPEGSNIRSFLDDFETVEGVFRPGTGDLWRIFGIREYNGDPESLPEESSLMRAYKEFMKNGGVMGSAVGYRI